MTKLTERQLLEKTYYEQYSNTFNLERPIDFSPVEGPLLDKERRPWNSYWRTYELAVDFFLSRETTTNNLQLLDFGCGPGDNSLRFSWVGFNVTGFDISENNIKTCKTLFEKYNIFNKSHFLVSAAETLPLKDDSFEVVVGIDILHHVDIPKALLEVKRVLKKDGIAIFREPFDVPLFDKLRNTKLVRVFFPNSVSLKAHITVDERKLNKLDLEIIKEIFPNTVIEQSLIFSRFDKFIRKNDNPNSSLLEQIDYLFCKIIPFFKYLGGGSVIILKK